MGTCKTKSVSRVSRYVSVHYIKYIFHLKGNIVAGKLIAAWRKLKNESTSSNIPSTQQIIVISTNEQEAMDKIQSALTDIDRLLKENANKQKTVNAATSRLSEEIEGTFSKYIAQMTERAMALKKKLTATSKSQIDALLQQQKKLQKMKETVMNGTEQQQSMIKDQKLDRKKRETKMQEITKNALNDMESVTAFEKIRDILFSHDDDAVSKVCIANFVTSIVDFVGFIVKLLPSDRSFRALQVLRISQMLRELLYRRYLQRQQR